MGVALAPSTILRWVIRYTEEFVRRWETFELVVGRSWRAYETYINVKGAGDSVAKTQKVSTNAANRSLCSDSEQLVDELHLRHSVAFATRLALPFLIISIASIPRRVRQAVGTDPYPLASHVRRFTFL